MIPPDLQHKFAQRMKATVIEVPSSHVPMTSHPDETAKLIEMAVQAVPTALK
jgi:hypothetical protein